MAYRDDEFTKAFSELDDELHYASADEQQEAARQDAAHAALREKYPSLKR